MRLSTCDSGGARTYLMQEKHDVENELDIGSKRSPFTNKSQARTDAPPPAEWRRKMVNDSMKGSGVPGRLFEEWSHPT